MNLGHEMARFSAMQIKEAKGLNSNITQGVNGVNKAMTAMGADNDALAMALSISGSALQVVGGTLGMLQGLKALYAAYTAREAGEAAALTAAKLALGPWGWAQIAIAGAASATAAAVMYGIVNVIEVGDFDLSTPAGVNGMLGALEAVM
jgi:hypothetical protein